MKKVKLSKLNSGAKVIVGNQGTVIEVSDLLKELDYYRNKKIQTTQSYHASLNAKDILAHAIEDEYCNFMYEDWDERIGQDITEQDIEDLQKIFDRILARSPEQNISYLEDKLIEFDI